MKDNIVAAMIIAVTLLVIASTARREAEGVVESALVEIEKAAEEKDASGNSQVARITEGISGSITQDIKKGFGFGSDEDRRAELDICDELRRTASAVVKVVALDLVEEGALP